MLFEVTYAIRSCTFKDIDSWGVTTREPDYVFPRHKLGGGCRTEINSIFLRLLKKSQTVAEILGLRFLLAITFLHEFIHVVGYWRFLRDHNGDSVLYELTTEGNQRIEHDEALV